jgi:hypothetical protein
MGTDGVGGVALVSPWSGGAIWLVGWLYEKSASHREAVRRRKNDRMIWAF